jgi:hypothetical protein
VSWPIRTKYRLIRAETLWIEGTGLSSPNIFSEAFGGGQTEKRGGDYVLPMMSDSLLDTLLVPAILFAAMLAVTSLPFLAI